MDFKSAVSENENWQHQDFSLNNLNPAIISMLNSSIRVLNFDGSILKQKQLTSQYKTEIIDLEDIGPRARVWLDKKARQDIQERIRGSSKNSVTFLGSGDFHHISNILISEFSEPLCIITFDSHPDWDILPPRLGCGSWVTETLKNKNIFKFILIGVSSSDISGFHIYTGNLNALRDNRMELYSYAHHPTKVFFKKVPHNISAKQGRKHFLYRRLHWAKLAGADLTKLFMEIAGRLPVKKAYLSIDKDCLKKEYALTNWEEGRLSLEELLLWLRLIKENLEIVGVDITGDYSPPQVFGKIKAFLSRLDHPHDYTARDKPEGVITSVNEETNIRILECLKI